MLSLLGSLLGFGTSFLPSVMDYFKQKQDNEQELAMMDKQILAQEKIAGQKLQMVEAQGDIDALKAALSEDKSTVGKSSQWVINLSATVRPIMTYALFLEFIALTALLSADVINQADYDKIWNNEMQAIWAAVVCFWFGARQFKK